MVRDAHKLNLTGVSDDYPFDDSSTDDARPSLDILALSADTWGDTLYSRHQLLTRIGREHHVVYSTGGRFVWQLGGRPANWTPFFGRFEPRDQVLVDIPPSVPFRVARSRFLDEWAVRRLAARLERRWKRSGANARVLWVFRPEFLPFLKHFDRDLLIYHACDLYSRMPGWTEEHARNELALCRTADIRIATSQVLANELETLSGEPVQTLANGVDCKAYANLAALRDHEPADIAEIPYPRLGYTGVLTRKVDFRLIREMASARPDWNFILVGPVHSLDADAATQLNHCRTLPNVHLLGEKPQRDIAAYVASMDVGLIPYKLGHTWTDAVNPLKLYEYLAAGIPTVCAPIRSVLDLGELVRCPERSAQAWVGAVSAALTEQDVVLVQKRIAAARARDWDRIAGGVLKIIHLELGHKLSNQTDHVLGDRQ